MNKYIFEDLDRLEYKEAWEYQEKLFNDIIEKKIYNREHSDDLKEITNRLLFVEHPHVYTLGKNGQQNNLLINDDFLAKIDATYYQSNRGGDITYHGPGQIVAYPIFDLDEMHLSMKEYIFRLEEAVIQCIAKYGIEGTRLEGATGVWLDIDKPGKVRKICAIGVKASRYVTMHGLALNVNTDLQYFNHINPCGFVDKGVTSLEQELGEKQDFEKIKSELHAICQDVFDLEH